MGALKGTYRRMTEWERNLILQLLSIPFPGRDALLRQLDDLTVTEIHEDGTPFDSNGSLYLKTSIQTKAEVIAPSPTEGVAPDSDGILIHYLLFAEDEGKMSQLEIFKEDSSKVIRHAEPDELEVIIAD